CRTVQPAHGDETSRHVLVAAGEGDQRVVPLRAHHGLDRIGDQVPRLQRIAHAVGAHRDAVADTDGVEPHADHAGSAHPATYFGRELEQVHVAGVAVVPDAGDADLRLAHVLGGEAGTVEHGLRGALRFGLGDVAAVDVELALVGHGCSGLGS